MKCHCGKPLHYKNSLAEHFVNEAIKKKGEFVTVRSLESGKYYKIPRHYIALHGLRGKELDSYGFKECPAHELVDD
jgi:hypothetical protein